tara:strand:+ start:161 stop:682 length:522 start_codon:yes stop_codon:yes gene_type:complete
MKHLFKALAAFQQEVKPIFKATKGYGYSYADLPTIFDKINPLLEKHGLGFTQLINTHEEDNYLNTIIFHVESGETLESNTLIPQVSLKGMNDYQSFGSGVTYFRRYALSSALGLVTDKDTDAAGEQVPVVKKEKKKLNAANFKAALEMIANGEYTAEKLKENYALTNKQLAEL